VNGWKIVHISDFCTTGTGGTPSRSNMERYYEGGKIPWIKSGELRETVINDTEEHVTEEALQETHLKLVPSGALLLAMYGATVGRLGILGTPATTNQAICHIIPDPKIADVCYLFHLLRAQVPNIVARGVGGAQPNISQGIVKDLRIPLPPLEEQKRIADILDRAEALRAKRRAALAQLNELTQAIFIEMFGDPVKNPKNWDKKSLEDLCSYIIDCPHSTPKYEECITLYPCIRTTELKNGYIDWSKMKYINEKGYKERTKRLIPVEGDIVYGREGTYGEAIRIPKNTNICLGQRVMLFRPNHNLCNSEFLWALVRSDGIYQQAFKKTSGSTVGHVNVNDIKKFICFCPPLLLQDEFSTIVKSIEILKEKQQQSFLEINNLFDSLMYEAFSGKLFSHKSFERQMGNGGN